MSMLLPCDRPWLLLALLLLPAYAWLRSRLWRRGAIPHAPLQHHPLAGRRPRLGRLRLPLELLLLAITIVGLAGPYRAFPLELVEDEGIDIALVLDISLSMRATDFEPDRITVLRRVAHDFIQRAGGHRLGIVVFARDTFVHTPLTTDRRALTTLLDSVTVRAVSQREGGTAIGDALLVAGEQLRKVRLEGRDQAMILITDGESNVGLDPLLAARHVRELGIRLAMIGVGGETPVEVIYEGERVGGDDNPYLAQLDDGQLQAIAAAADGLYFRATDGNALARIFTYLARLERAPLAVREVEIHHAYTSVFALAALPLFALYLVFNGVLLRRPLR